VSRQIGPIGTAGRAIAGSAAIAYTVIAHGLALWDLAAGLIAFPILAIGVGLTFVTPIDGGAIFLFFGASLLIVAARGDAGCEVLAVVNAISGHRDKTGCVAFAPVDSLEGRLEARST
jgi:hypothetical protein